MRKQWEHLPAVYVFVELDKIVRKNGEGKANLRIPVDFEGPAMAFLSGSGLVAGPNSNLKIMKGSLSSSGSSISSIAISSRWPAGSAGLGTHSCVGVPVARRMCSST
jgi:hypothetical protein